MCWLQQCMRAACLLEVRAPKPGNVHPQAAFDDLTYDDFVKKKQRRDAGPALDGSLQAILIQ